MISWTSSEPKGWHWNGATWVEDSSIISGILHPGPNYGYAVYQVGNTFHLIQEDYNHNEWDGYTWDGSHWVVNNSVVQGLNYPDVFCQIEVFVLDNTYHAIGGSNTLGGNVHAWTDGTYVAPFATPTPTPEPTIIPVIAPPPLIPTEVPRPMIIEETELTIIEETLILITNLMGKALSWAFLLASYIGAILSCLLLKGKDEESNALDIFLFGTIGWVLLLLINTTGYITVVTPVFIINALIFGIAGFVTYIILNMATSKE